MKVRAIRIAAASMALCMMALGCSGGEGANPAAPEIAPPSASRSYGPIWQALDLTDMQRQQMAALREKHHQQMMELKSSFEQSESREAAREARKALRDQMRSELATILSPDQFAKLAQLRAEGRAEDGRHARADGVVRAEHRQQRLNRLTDILELTAEQQAQVTAVFEDLRPAEGLSRADRRQMREEHRAEIEARLKAILTTEQFEKFLGIRAERGAGKRSWRSSD